MTVPKPSATAPRVEFRGFQNLDDHRIYRMRAVDGDTIFDLQLRIALAAFTQKGVRLQDGPDVCFQVVQRLVASGTSLQAAAADVITVGEDDLDAYRDAHTAAVRTRRPPANPRPERPRFTPPPPRTLVPAPAPAPPVPAGPPPLQEGQRVHHPAFGDGVTMACDAKRIVVRFDAHGPKTFLTSMVRLDVLSAPHTWEAPTRGKNRPRTAR